MKPIGWLIETEPQYNGLYQEMYPVAKIEAEVEMILAAGKRYREQNEMSVGSLHKANKPFPRKRKV